jgi:hypothetical protein
MSECQSAFHPWNRGGRLYPQVYYVEMLLVFLNCAVEETARIPLFVRFDMSKGPSSARSRTPSAPLSLTFQNAKRVYQLYYRENRLYHQILNPQKFSPPQHSNSFNDSPTIEETARTPIRLHIQLDIRIHSEQPPQHSPRYRGECLTSQPKTISAK